MNTAGIHERSETIDCLRCLAVLWVVEYHLSPIRIFDRGTFGVLLFFIISGYCIAFSANSSTSAWHFSARRIGRILPALVVCSFITVAVKSMWPAFVDPGRQNSWFDWLYTPFAIVTLNFLSLDYRPADGAYWSLQVEFQFYVLYAAILLLGMKNYAVQVVCAFALMISLSASPGSNSSYDFFPYFLAGMSVARDCVRRSKKRIYRSCIGLFGRSCLPDPGLSSAKSRHRTNPDRDALGWNGRGLDRRNLHSQGMVRKGLKSLGICRIG